MVERVRRVRAKEADVIRAEFPEGLHGVGHDVGEPREDDALALVDEAVDERPPEAPDDPALRGQVGPEFREKGEP
eukprot:11756320-Alexandrium_andersonii.AAC.1